MADAVRETLLRLLEEERVLRRRAEESLHNHSIELMRASDELMNQADALVERDRLAHQMAIARRIQLAVLPPPVKTARYEIATAMDATDAVGGDFCDVYDREGTLWLGIGDVTGHGVDAGLIMLMAQSGFAVATAAWPEASALTILEHLNRLLYQNIRRRMKRDDHMTFVAVRLQPDGLGEFAGGHDVDLIVVHRDGAIDLHACEGMWLGVRPELSETRSQTFRLRDDDLLVMATDGLVESPGAHLESFGPARLADLVAHERTRNPSQIVECVRAAVTTWRSAAPAPRAAARFDDSTLIVARYRETSTHAHLPDL
jgi:sigma-B regulation protein RsbU (phosphoserine phosphatase)